jgi:ribose transport system substrate-binding protein
MQELLDFGAPCVAIGGCTQSPSPAQFCLATDVYRSAYLGTKALIKEMGGKGNILHTGSRLVDPNTQLRIKAIDKAIEEAGPEVKLYQHLTDTDSQETGDKKINGLLAAKGAEVDGIISTGYVSSVVAARALRNIGDKRIKMIGIDDDPIVLQAIKDGFLQGTMAQNPYGQGYIAAFVLKRLHEGCKIKKDAPFQETPQNKTFIDSGTLLIHTGNIDTYKDELKKIATEIIGSFEDKYLTCK